ncbi:uncharacterized protein B0H64DRAFT_435555 [Chaetomium fimeti]|uniref:Uncharacterized protein n=1 Tax=Chaetomium fimeti TaxID=1854472 RepID=A0AAE0H8G5_9PEZI|nr:hypothetical protein B0H64DRAFT_435555 [Chaetomium fimeti]
MRYLSLAVLSLLGAASMAVAERPCGFKIAPCPDGEICEKVDPNCNKGVNCQGICVKAAFCGGIAGVACEPGMMCVDDPTDDCDPKNGGADCGGICVKPPFCGGFSGTECEDGKKCVDDPSDDCDPENGGADCSGICV